MSCGGNCEGEAGELAGRALGGGGSRCWRGKPLWACGDENRGERGLGAVCTAKGPLGRASRQLILCSFLLYLSLHNFNKNMGAN